MRTATAGLVLAVAGVVLSTLLLTVGPAIVVTAGAGEPGAASTGLPLTGVGLSADAAADLRAGTIDGRVVDVLAWLGTRHRITVSVLRTGHSEFVTGTSRVSNHWWGRAGDIATVDGEAVSSDNPAARQVVVELMSLGGAARPSEIGEPFADLAGGIVFSDDAHRNHIHVGYGPAT